MEKYPLVNVYIATEHHHVLRENPLFLWPLSIAMFDITRGYAIHVPNHQPDITVQYYCSTIINYKSHVPNPLCANDIPNIWIIPMLFLWPKNLPNHQPFPPPSPGNISPWGWPYHPWAQNFQERTRRRRPSPRWPYLWRKIEKSVDFATRFEKNGNDRLMFVIIYYRITHTYRSEKGYIICIYQLHVIFRIYIYMIYIYI